MEMSCDQPSLIKVEPLPNPRHDLLGDPIAKPIPIVISRKMETQAGLVWGAPAASERMWELVLARCKF